MSARMTGSSADRAAACAASHALPAVHAPASQEAADGTSAHALIETATASWPEREPAIASLGWDPRAYLPAGAHRTEEPYWYAPSTDEAGPIIGAGHRDYTGAPPHAIPMTLDVVTVGDVVTVTDWKCGNAFVSADTLQLTLAALAVSRAHGVDSVTVRIGQGGVGTPPIIRERVLDSFELDASADHVRRIAERVAEARTIVAAGGVPDVHPSEDACRYCPCKFSGCPAYSGVVRQVVTPEATPESVAAMIAAMGPEEAGAAWVLVKRAEEVIEAAGKALRAMAEHSPLPLPGGRELYMQEVVQMRPEMAPTGAKREIRFLKTAQRKRTA